MKMQKSTQCLIASWLLLLVLIPLDVSAERDGPRAQAICDSLIVQTLGNPVGFAIPGTSGFSQSADISVVVTTRRGEAVSDLGPPFIGDGSSVISLPPEWTFRGNFTRPHGACALSPNQFFNVGNGQYVIRVVSHPVDCPWVAGDYHYVVQINRSEKHFSPLQGSALGVLPIRSSF
jgi:hypothetical protein